MKTLIYKTAKELGIDVSIDIYRREFDIYDYTVYANGSEDTFTYYTGKTKTAVQYPFDKDQFIKNISDFLKKINCQTEDGRPIDYGHNS